MDKEALKWPPRHNAHSVTDLKAHLVITPKYRQDILRFKIREAAVPIFNQIFHDLNINVIETAINPEHCHFAIDYPPYLSISKIMQFLKGKSSYLLRRQFSILPDYCPKHLWSDGYYAGGIGNNPGSVIKYIANQAGG